MRPKTFVYFVLFLSKICIQYCGCSPSQFLRIAIAIIQKFLIGAYLQLVHCARATKQEGPTLIHLIVKYFCYKNLLLHLESIHIEKSFCVAFCLL